MASATHTLISAQTLGSTTQSVTFSSIPATYNDLKLVISVRSSVATTVTGGYIQFNGDTATNYSFTDFTGSASAGGAGRASSATSFRDIIIEGTSYTSNVFTSSEFYIPNYTVSAYKPFFGIQMTENNSAAASYIYADAGLWCNNAAITSILVSANSNGFVTNSTFYLYGIKNS